MRLVGACAAVVCAASLVTVPVHASLNGIIGYSGKFSATCDSCHDDAVQPLVSFEGPERFAADTLAEFRFIVRSQAERQHAAGFNVAVSDGLLSINPEQNARVEINELTHNSPQENDETGEASWVFEWCVPNGGDYRLFGSGNSVNGNGTRSGDASNAIALDVHVTPPAGDINCDGRRSAADVTAVFTSVTAAIPGVCESPDDVASGSDQVDSTIALLFTPSCTF